MENLYIAPGKATPEVDFRTNGYLKMTGRSIPEDPSRLYDSVYLWIFEYCLSPAEKTVADFHLEYFNSGSSRSILIVMRELVELSRRRFNVTINWFYDEEDEDIKEFGEYCITILEYDINIIQVSQKI